MYRHTHGKVTQSVANQSHYTGSVAVLDVSLAAEGVGPPLAAFGTQARAARACITPGRHPAGKAGR